MVCLLILPMRLGHGTHKFPVIRPNDFGMSDGFVQRIPDEVLGRPFAIRANLLPIAIECGFGWTIVDRPLYRLRYGNISRRKGNTVTVFRNDAEVELTLVLLGYR